MPPATSVLWITQGYLTLIGRKVDLIITKGFNVYPPMVERVLNDCPGVKESAVFGLPDDLRGEKVVAVVVKDPAAGAEATPRAIRDFCRERSVDYQVPSPTSTSCKNSPATPWARC